ncbi:hypothetical protein ACTI_73200 [Actinoplanes sp. OR16]|uniref:hypothetical protein n=1 Tax=Actinoplanes sp. OR16 TaxID=946334 RepID=UPI000F6BDBD7|nr:hypothetical protein [Actinoplanes sp. OR16]BBH70635.1 hypothetical protein ACTI_73200 [Actinoplanes sp. OR16]
MDLEEWRQSIQPWLVGLEAALDVDFSRASLARLEELAAEDDGPAYAAYLGETLLRVGGGRWIDLDGDPGVTADPVLGLAPVVPAELLTDPGRAIEVYDAWAAAASASPTPPVKEPTPGLDERPAPAEPAELHTWLATQEARWPHDAGWDFSPSSLDRLTDLLVQRLGDPSGLKDPANREFVDGAAWYLGETFRRSGRGDWSWHDTKGPYVINLGTDGRSQLPLVQLRLGMRTRGYLRSRCGSLSE